MFGVEAMTKIAAFLLGLMLVLLAPVSVAHAGLFELIHDDITTSCDHDVEPCKRNDIGFKTRYVRGKYLRYDVKTTKARYTWVRERVMVAPPRLVSSRRHHKLWTHKIDGKHLVPVGASGHTRVMAPAQYATVMRRVLVSPARNRVVRRQPHSAYFADTIIVRGGGCKLPLAPYSCENH
jgi:hypothetical protein